MLRVKRCGVASLLDVATVRDDHYAVVVESWQQASQGEALRPEDAKPDVQRSLATRSGGSSFGKS